MKKIKIFVTTILLLTSTTITFADDYAIIDNYPLLNEMKSAKQQQAVLDDIQTTIIEHKYNSQQRLTKLKSQFNTTINSLSKSTRVTIIKNKIEELKLQWIQNSHLLDSAINSEMYKKDALKSLSQLSKTLRTLNNLYAQSYARFKRNSIMKSLVSSYMKTQEVKKSKYALNISQNS